MSQKNVETMQRAMDAFNKRDGNAFDCLLADDAVIMPVRASLEGTTYSGHDAGTQYCSAVAKSWHGLRWRVEEMREGDGWVLALGRIRSRGRDSGAMIDARAGWLAHFREGRITRFQTFTSRENALKAAGLSE